MSAPAFAWALERGAALGLTPSERLVLIYLADMANGERVCWPGQPRIVRYTGLAPNTVIATLKKLGEKQLIRAETSPGRVTHYLILRELTPANGAGATPANSVVVTPANGAGAPPQNVYPHPRNRSAKPPHDLGVTPANGGGDPSTSQESYPKKAAQGAEASEVSSLGNEGKQARAATTASAPPKAPVLGTTTGSGLTAYRVPGADDPFGDWLAEGTPASHPGRPAALLVAPPDTITEDDPPQTEADRARMAAQFAQLAHDLGRGMRHFAIPRRPVRSPSEQQDQVLHGEVLEPELRRKPVDPVRTVAEQLAALGFPNLATAHVP
jgi:Helix-turn-helix domain